jgi:two-component system alkaline phosphatase synthesis response regulator PhoP
MNSRLLIIEDERPMRTALADCLETEGYRVLTAADGEAGLDRALEEKPDLILLDIMMPKLDGFALCAELRRLGHLTPVLMLTAKGQVEDRVRGLDVGADDYLVKPFSTPANNSRRSRWATCASISWRCRRGAGRSRCT